MVASVAMWFLDSVTGPIDLALVCAYAKNIHINKLMISSQHEQLLTVSYPASQGEHRPTGFAVGSISKASSVVRVGEDFNSKGLNT